MTDYFHGQRISYALHAELAKRHVEPPPGPETGTLTRFELSVTSQNGEDGVIAELLRRVGATSRHFVEFGAEHWEGNCQFLADVLEWRGLYMTGNPDFAWYLERKYRGNPGVTVLEAMVTPENLDGLLRQAEGPWEPDVFSIDVDGNDFWIWDSLSACHPRIVIVEYNSHLDPTACLVQPLSDSYVEEGSHTDWGGASAGALRLLGRHLGYTLVHTDLHGVNAFFVRDDLVPLLGPLDLDRVPLRAPNFYGHGKGHDPDPEGRGYLDVTGLLVELREWPDPPTPTGDA